MTIIHISFAHIQDQKDPMSWLKQIPFYTGILDQMADKGISVKSIHCIDHTGILNVNKVEYHFLKLKRWQMFAPLQLIRYVKRLEPDTVIVHGLIFSVQVILLGWLLNKNVKIIAQHHAERPFADVRKHLQRLADGFIKAYFFTGMDLAKHWLSSKQIASKTKVYEVMEASSSFHVMNRDEARAITRVTDGPVYLWVGRLDTNKNPLMLASAFLRFASAHPNAKLYIIYQSYELETELKNLISASTNIVAVGRVPHEALPSWYNSADFIISTSLYEGSGIAVCEAMSCGCIPVLSNIPSFAMMSDNGDIGLLYKAGDENGLVNALEQSILMDIPAERVKVLKQFKETLSFEAIARKMIQVIQRIV